MTTEATRLLRHLERVMRRKVNSKRCPDNRVDIVTQSFTNTRIARDAGISIDLLQRARQELIDAGLIWPVLSLPFKRGEARQPCHRYTLKIKKTFKDSRQL